MKQFPKRIQKQFPKREHFKKGAIIHHDYGQADPTQEWEADANVRKADIETLRKICAWYDSENSQVKGAYKLPHHDADTFKAVWNGVKSAMSVLLGAMGGVDIPDSDRKAVYNHLVEHYKEFGKEIPPFRISKMFRKDEAEQVVYGVVYAPDEVDAQEDSADAEEIRKACYRFMESGGQFQSNHNKEPIDVVVLENYLAPVDFHMQDIEGNVQQIQKGSWVQALKIKDADTWQEITKGTITGFSMGGEADI